MKRLALALILVLALGSTAYAVTPSFSTTVTLAGSETWVDLTKTTFTAPSTPTIGFNVSASGTGYSVNAAYTLGGNVSAVGKPIVNTLGKYTAKFTDGKMVFDIWGNAAETSDVSTLLGEVKAVKAASGSNWRLRSTYDGGKVIADFDNGASLLKAFAKTQVSDKLTVGAAIEKNLNKLNDDKVNVDVWASTTIGNATVNGELISRNLNATDTSDAFFQVKAPVAGFSTTSSIEYRTNESWNKKYNNTTVALSKNDITINGIMTNKENNVQLLRFNAKKDTGLSYIFGEFGKNLDKVNVTVTVPVTSNVMRVSAEFGMRGSNDQVWADVFATASDKWLKNKTWVAVVKAANVMASKKASDGTAITGDTNPTLTASAEGVYCLIPNKMWAHGLATFTLDKDVVAYSTPKIDVSANARHKHALTSKIALDSNAAIGMTEVGRSSSNLTASIGTQATYTFATNMNVYASIKEDWVLPSGGSLAAANTLSIGYTVKF